MAIVTGTLAAVGLATSAASMIGGMGAAAKAKQAAQEQAYLTALSGLENIRRQADTDRRTTATGYAAGYASGTQMRAGNSQQGYMQSLQAEQARQLDWERKSVLLRFKAERKGASIQAGTDRMNSLTSGLTGMANAGQNVWDSGGKQWWNQRFGG